MITRMVNMSLGTVHFSNDWKFPLVQPTLLVLFHTVDDGIAWAANVAVTVWLTR